ncbi:uncharacterized protein BP5553_00525 [Venustampulla echinocandica]|uniref:C2H2-type domain-containing protein n=1 Tax=Venustampulla echinocandica TaxID=2656787 RepID=A0A370TYD8_9HELO|nr:uncharacterized protein BP5553_00525 [Venustampulla echinocandica]RDL40546.1 hypothetical protein BP5553_00525 [Venustampulla echinocandica]
MSVQLQKRKAPTSLEGFNKRLRVERPSPLDDLAAPENDDEDYEHSSSRSSNAYSEEGNEAETPITPCSPARKKFPSELKTIKCHYPGCYKTFNRPVRLQSHMRSHVNERSCVCQYEGCDKAYFEEKHLQQHIKGSHTKERTYVCDWEGCTKSFLTGTRLRRHKEAHEGHERFRCTAYPPCNQTFRKHQTLQRHIRSDHLQLTPFPCTYIDPVTKVACNAGFDGAVGLRKHEERVHATPGFACTACPVLGSFNPDGSQKLLGFATKAQLQTHIRKEHANCMFCDLKCSSQRELQSHIESQHSGKSLDERKTVRCTYIGCDSTFTKKSNLAVHVRSIHNGERYICGTLDISSNPELAAFAAESGCGKDFVSKANLEGHIRNFHLRMAGNTSASLHKTRTPKPKPSAIDELMGNSYAADPKRNIPCLAPTCLHKFIRDYDLQVHMRTAHNSFPGDPSMEIDTDFAGLPLGESSNEGVATPEMGDPLCGTPDIDWELQRRALEGGPFWVGATNPSTPNQDSWKQEEAEMRQLIDFNEGVLDPSLVGL